MVIEARLFDKPVRQAESLNGDYHAVRLTTLSIGRSMLSDGKALFRKEFENRASKLRSFQIAHLLQRSQ